MSFTPIIAKLGIATFTLSRVDRDQLRLECVTEDAPDLKVSIVFPQTMVLELFHRAMRVHFRMTADQMAKRVFPQLFLLEPVWPADPFEDLEG